MDVFLRKPEDADELKRRIRQARDANSPLIFPPPATSASLYCPLD